jgi:hypothetical protein
MSLKPRYPNITFLDLVTLKPKCDFNGCIDKFKLNEDAAIKRPVSRGRPANIKPVYIYECSECGRRVQETEMAEETEIDIEVDANIDVDTDEDSD